MTRGTLDRWTHRAGWSSGRGQELESSASGYTPETTVTQQLFSDPVTLGAFRTDGAGRLEALATIPASMELGEHTLEVQGISRGQSHVVRVPVIVVDAGAGAASTPSAAAATPKGSSATGTPATLAYTGSGARVLGLVRACPGAARTGARGPGPDLLPPKVPRSLILASMCRRPQRLRLSWPASCHGTRTAPVAGCAPRRQVRRRRRRHRGCAPRSGPSHDRVRTT